MSDPAVDVDRLHFDRAVRGMSGVLAVRDEHPVPGAVTIRVVARHGDRIRRAAGTIAPPDLALHVLEDDLVTSVPHVQPSIAPSPTQQAASETARRAAAARARSGDALEPGEQLRCSYVFCRHATTPDEFGAQAGDACRRKTRTPAGWLACPGHYERVETRRWRRRLSGR